jgi:hypothetical protein
MSETDILPAPEIESSAPVEPSKWEREKRAFRRLLPDLLKTHRGQYVAIHNEQVVGSGPDQFELARESYQRFGYVPIYVGLITDEPARPVRIPSPRLHLRQGGSETG